MVLTMVVMKNRIANQYGSPIAVYKWLMQIIHCIIFFLLLQNIYLRIYLLRRPPHGAHPLSLISGVQWEQVLPQPKVGVASCSLNKNIIGGCVDLCVNTMHRKDPLIFFGCVGSAFFLLLLFFTIEINALSLCFNNDNGPPFWRILWY